MAMRFPISTEASLPSCTSCWTVNRLKPGRSSLSWAGAREGARMAAATNQERMRMIFRCSLKRSVFAVLERDGYGVVCAKWLIRVLKLVDGDVLVFRRR